MLNIQIGGQFLKELIWKNELDVSPMREMEKAVLSFGTSKLVKI